MQAGHEVAAGSGERGLPAALAEHGSADFPKAQPGTIHIELRQAQVRIEGSADVAWVRVLLECLRG